LKFGLAMPDPDACGLPGDKVAGVTQDVVGVDPGRLQDGAGDGILLVEDRHEEVRRTDVRVPVGAGGLQCRLHRLLGTGSGGESAHRQSPFLRVRAGVYFSAFVSTFTYGHSNVTKVESVPLNLPIVM
jgi:hypothetical protein